MEVPEISYIIIFGIGIIGILIIFLVIVWRQFYTRNTKYLLTMKALERQFQETLLQAQLEIQEQTFNTISQEIHDNVGQILSLAKVQVNIMDQSEVIDRSMLGDVKDSIGKAMADLRDIAKSLNSERIKLFSLAEMTSDELQRINRLGIMKAVFYTEGREQKNMPEQKKLITFRIIQESLQNILKHSKAEKVNVFFLYHSDHLTIEIADNGIGFDQNLINNKEGLGLQNILSRATLIGGRGSINSTLNLGTTITIMLPYA